MAFYDNFVRLCAEKGVSPSAAAIEIGIKKSNVTYWKNSRNNPSDVTLAKLADYFGVFVSDLTEEKEKSPTPNGVELDAETIELREIWNSADQEEREALLAMAKMLKSRRNK